MREGPVLSEEDIREINESSLSYEAAKSINDMVVFVKKNNEILDNICYHNDTPSSKQ